jgi:hypothetical protein
MLDPKQISHMDQVTGLGKAQVSAMDKVVQQKKQPQTPEDKVTGMGKTVLNTTQGIGGFLNSIGLGGAVDIAANTPVAQEIQSASGVNPLENSQLMKDKMKNPLLSGAQDVVGAASWMVPETKALQAVPMVGKTLNAARAVPYVGKAVNPLLNVAKGAMQGGLQNASQQGATPDSIMNSAEMGGFENPLLSLGGKLATKGFQSAGKAIMGNVINPLTKNAPGWAAEKGKAIQAIADSTGGAITHGSIDKHLTDNLTRITNEIKDKLGKYKGNNFNVNNLVSNIEDHLGSNVAGYVKPELKLKSSGRGQQSKPEHDMVNQFHTLMSKFAERGIGKNSRKIETEITPLNLFKLKQEWGKVLSGSGVWNRQEPSVADNTGKAIYGYLKDAMTKNIDPSIAKATEIEHQLFDVSHGNFKGGNRSQSMDMGSMGSIINTLAGMRDFPQMAAGRVLYGAGKLNEKATPPPVQKILQQLGISLPNNALNLPGGTQ